MGIVLGTPVGLQDGTLDGRVVGALKGEPDGTALGHDEGLEEGRVVGVVDGSEVRVEMIEADFGSKVVPQSPADSA